MATSVLVSKETEIFQDGITEYKPLRSDSKYHLNKAHIADTPMNWSNIHLHVNWINATLILIIPLVGFISAYWVPLRLYTAVWAIIFYFNTGLGITAGEFLLKNSQFSLLVDTNLLTNSHRLPSLVGSHFLQGHQPPQDLPRCGWCRCCSGLHPLVVPRPPRSSPVHQY
jgi:hypothetical protein